MHDCYAMQILEKQKQQKQSQNEMHKYYTMQILEKRENKSNKEEWSQRVE